MTSLRLPAAGGRIERYQLTGAARRPPVTGTRPQPHSRRAFAAAHVVLDPLRTVDAIGAPVIDWDATLRFRHHVWDLGLGVAEAMDTAQRGMGLPGEMVRELIERSAREADSRGAVIGCGANTDGLPTDSPSTLQAITAAYLEQCEWIEGAGGQVILMASRALCRSARSAEDYQTVYTRVLQSLSRPAILHWLGDAFDPLLSGYWGATDLDVAADSVVELINSNVNLVEGIKISLLDADREVALRRRLPEHVRMYTGDDFNYPDLIRGDEQGHSDALLGIFDAIAPLASDALARLDAGDVDGFDSILGPTVPLSRAIFEAPTYRYKTGVVFLAYLRGLQDHFTMLGGAESARSIEHLARLFRLADTACLLDDPDLAVSRMLPVLACAGINGRDHA